MSNQLVPPGSECSGESHDQDAVWVTLVRVLPPDDIIIESLLRSQEIPYRIERNPISQIPLSVGPFAEAVIMVPQAYESEARSLLEPVPQQGDTETLEGE
ncbi:MAG: hypothetical protein GXZ09_02415 [Syntrophomonadaceae bacterium]|nr:hypothetical protein [Syntrophomonadaceae bacterium]